MALEEAPNIGDIVLVYLGGAEPRKGKVITNPGEAGVLGEGNFNRVDVQMLSDGCKWSVWWPELTSNLGKEIKCSCGQDC